MNAPFISMSLLLKQLINSPWISCLLRSGTRFCLLFRHLKLLALYNLNKGAQICFFLEELKETTGDRNTLSKWILLAKSIENCSEKFWPVYKFCLFVHCHLWSSSRLSPRIEEGKSRKKIGLRPEWIKAASLTGWNKAPLHLSSRPCLHCEESFQVYLPVKTHGEFSSLTLQ